MHTVYVNQFAQISVQEPFSAEWTENSKKYSGQKLVEIINPDYKKYFSSSVLRRNGNLLQRAMLVAKIALENADLQNVDAVITGTGLGAVENTELFLKQLVYSGEDFLKPSYFMQSTHNTASSVIAMFLKCNGYNSTYCQKGLSFESAVLDAYLQISNQTIKNAFVGGFDEVSPDYFTILEKSGYLGGTSTGFAASASVGGVLSDIKTEKTVCKIAAVNMVYRPTDKDLKQIFSETLADSNININDLTAVMIGINGNKTNDEIYYKNIEMLGLKCPKLQYANIFGECYTASAYGFYAAVECFKANEIFKTLTINSDSIKNPENILLYRQYDNKNHCFILLQKC